MREGFFPAASGGRATAAEQSRGSAPKHGAATHQPGPPPRLRLLLPAAPVVGRPLPWQRGAAEGRGLTAGYEEQVECSG